MSSADDPAAVGYERLQALEAQLSALESLNDDELVQSGCPGIDWLHCSGVATRFHAGGTNQGGNSPSTS